MTPFISIGLYPEAYPEPWRILSPAERKRSLQDTSELHFFILFVLDIVRVNRWLFRWDCVVVALWQDVFFHVKQIKSVEQTKTCFEIFTQKIWCSNLLILSLTVTKTSNAKQDNKSKQEITITWEVWCWVSSKLLEKSPELGRIW